MSGATEEVQSHRLVGMQKPTFCSCFSSFSQVALAERATLDVAVDTKAVCRTNGLKERSKRCVAEDVLPLLVALPVVALAVAEGYVVTGVEVVSSEVVVRTHDRRLELDPGMNLFSTRNFLLPPLIAGSGLS